MGIKIEISFAVAQGTLLW